MKARMLCGGLLAMLLGSMSLISCPTGADNPPNGGGPQDGNFYNNKKVHEVLWGKWIYLIPEYDEEGEEIISESRGEHGYLVTETGVIGISGNEFDIPTEDLLADESLTVYPAWSEETEAAYQYVLEYVALSREKIEGSNSTYIENKTRGLCYFEDEDILKVDPDMPDKLERYTEDN